MGLGLGLALGGILVSIGRRAVLAEKFGLWTHSHWTALVLCRS